MNNLMQNFMYQGYDVEVIVLDDTPYFNANQVGEILEIAKVRNTIEDYNDKQKIKITNDMLAHTMGVRKMHHKGENFLTEAGVYKLVFKSRKPEAERFTDWVVEEVLPSIRKTGSYYIQQTPSYMIVDPIERAKKWIEEETLRQEQAKLIEEQQPKVEYYKDVMNVENGLTVTNIAKSFGMSARSLNKILETEKVQYKRGNQWYLYSSHQDKGYTLDRTYLQDTMTLHSTLWTEKGKEFIYELLLDRGYID